MAQYGLSLWGDDYYGIDVFIDYSVGEVTALQSGYGEITLTWTTPVEDNNWDTLRIVRNTAGYPADETDDAAVPLSNGAASQPQGDDQNESQTSAASATQAPSGLISHCLDRPAPVPGPGPSFVS